MTLTARDVMTEDVKTVAPDLGLVELERQFLRRGASGFPVTDGGDLCGIVSRSDVVRQLGVEQSLAETVCDYHRAYEDDSAGEPAAAHESFAEICERVGRRLEELSVRDVMMQSVVDVAPDAPIDEVARTLVKHRIHRVPVVRRGRLEGIITTHDLTKLIADGKLSDSPERSS